MGAISKSQIKRLQVQRGECGHYNPCEHAKYLERTGEEDRGRRDQQITALEAQRAVLLNAVYVAHGTFARQLGRDGYAPDSWGDDEHEAFGTLERAIAKAEGKS